MKSPFNDNNIDEIFSRELKDYQTTAPKGVWGKISSQLKIKRRPVQDYFLSSIFVVTIALISWWSIKSPEPGSFVANKKVSLKDNTVKITSIHAPNTGGLLGNSLRKNSISLPKTNSGIANNVSKTEYAKNLAATTNSTTEINPTQPFALALEPTNDATTVQSVSKQEISYIHSKANDMMELGAEPLTNFYGELLTSNIPAPATLSNKKINGFYFGINSSVNSVWILDNVALHDANFHYKSTAGFAYGVQGGYNFSNNFGLETGITVNSRNGQNYTYYLNSIQPVDKSAVLNYTEIPLIAKYKIPQISAFTEMPVVLNVNLGFSYGYLRSAYTFVNGDKTGSQNQYPTNQFNLLAGFSYDIYTKHTYSFSFGLMAQYGLNTTENDNSPPSTFFTTVTNSSRYLNGSDFNSPHNLSVGINAAINYNFSLFHR